MTRRAEEPRRLDIILVDRGLTKSRTAAQELVRAGRVLAAGTRCSRPGALFPPGTHIVVVPGRDFVSRGGQKLDAALDTLGVDVRDKNVADVGASTGGFTDCVLQRGARHVVAVDSGRDQLDPRLRDDPRITCREGVNARDLIAADFDEPVGVVVVDASFISLEKLAPALARILPEGGELVALVKPQFEVGPALARKHRGVIRSAEDRALGISSARRALEAAGFSIRGACDSAVPGRRGNVEHFVYAVRRQ